MIALVVVQCTNNGHFALFIPIIKSGETKIENSRNIALNFPDI